MAMLEINLGPVRNYLDQIFKKDEEASLVRIYSGQDTILAAVSYVPFVSAGILVLRKGNSEFVSFHARQALVMALITALLLMLSPGFLKLLAAILACVLLIFGTFRALQGRKWYLPFITELANTIEM